MSSSKLADLSEAKVSVVARASLVSKGSTISSDRGRVERDKIHSGTFSKNSRECLAVEVVPEDKEAQPGGLNSRLKAKTLL